MSNRAFRDIRGFRIYNGYLPISEQSALLDDLREVVRKAPLFTPQTPYGRPMSVRMTSAGAQGWFADKSGYRYIGAHPNGQPWPTIPHALMIVWARLSGVACPPDCCLINFYGAGARMGMHQDKDEADLRWPVVSVSLGDEALFRIGNRTRGGPTESIWLHSGDVVVMAGEARLSYHGVDRIRFGSSSLLRGGGRINVTLRVARAVGFS